MESKLVNCSGIKISNKNKICLIAGPCQLETEQHAMDMAGKIKEISSKYKIGLIYKTSFDKANRTSIKGKRGAGLENSLPVFDKIKKELNIPVLTDVHTEEQCSVVAPHVDVLQIPAFLCRQTDLLLSAGKTNKIVNVKKGQFLSPRDIPNIIEKIISTSNDNIMITERGTSFGYNNLVSDFRSLDIMKETKYPIIYDVTHSIQEPGGFGTSSGGKREFIPSLSKAAISIGVAGLFIETHDNPNNAPSDGPNMLNINNLKKLLIELKEFDKLAKS